MFSNNTNLNRSNSNRSNNGRNSHISPTPSRTSTALGSIAKAKKSERRYVFHCIPARVGLGMFVPLLFFFAIFMIVAGALVGGRLVSHVKRFSRLAIIFQLTNYSIVLVIAGIGIYAMIRQSLRATQLLTSFLVIQLPFGIVAGAMSMRVIFRAASSAALSATSTNATVEAPAEELVARAAESWEGTCSAALNGLTFICKRWKRVQPLIIVAYLLFWFLEMIIIYISAVYVKQLLLKRQVKILEDDDA